MPRQNISGAFSHFGSVRKPDAPSVLKQDTLTTKTVQTRRLLWDRQDDGREEGLILAGPTFQWVTIKRKVMSGYLLNPNLLLAPVAQRIEQLPSKQTVGGSTPSGGASTSRRPTRGSLLRVMRSDWRAVPNFA